MAAEIFLLVAVISLVYAAAAAVHLIRRARWFRQVAQLERTRTHWAEARMELFDLVRRDKLDPRSATFRSFYDLQTEILRHPEAYEGISRDLQESGFAGRTRAGNIPWLAEMHAWPREMSGVLARMNDGLAALAACYRPGGRMSRILQQRVRTQAVSMPPSAALEQVRQGSVTHVLTRAQREIHELERFAAAQPALAGGGSQGAWMQ